MRIPSQRQSYGYAYVNVRPTTSDGYQFVRKDYGYLVSSTGGGTTYHTSTISTARSLFNVTAYLTRTYSLDMGISSGQYRIFSQQNCPRAISCYDVANERLFLGFDNTTYGWDYQSKAIIGHELGHFISDRLFGQLAFWNYSEDGGTSQPECRCAHVPHATNQAHCLGSREHFVDAITEGWAHFQMTAVAGFLDFMLVASGGMQSRTKRGGEC